MKYLIKRFFNNYLYCIGLSAILIALSYHFAGGMSAQNGMDILKVMIVASIPFLLSTTLLLKNGLPLHVLWIRRAISMIIGGTVYPLTMIIFGLVKRENIQQYLIFILMEFCAVSISCSIAYIIGDKIEQYNIKKINQHLKNNNFEK